MVSRAMVSRAMVSRATVSRAMVSRAMVSRAAHLSEEVRVLWPEGSWEAQRDLA